MKQKNDAASCAVKTSIGGQALMEGIMMRGPQKTALAVRNTKGEIVVEESETKGKDRPKICRLPVIRGVFGYIDSMSVGYRALMRSAELSGLEDVVEESPKKKKKREAAERAAREAAGNVTQTETETPEVETLPVEIPAEQIEKVEEKSEKNEEKNEEKIEKNEEKAEKNEEKKEEKLPSWVFGLIMGIAMVVAFAFAFGLFFFVPTLLYDLLAANVSFLKSGNTAMDSLWKSVFEGVLKILLLVGYMAAISLMKDIRRTFMFHGAEHKTIFCYEAGLPLTVENIRRQRRFHPRCGTSFLILMLLVSIFISFFIDPIAVAATGEVLPIYFRVPLKILLLPLIVGVGYELIKLAGRHDNLFTRIISAPGVWLQHITVFEPTDDMIECAIEAMNRVIPADRKDDQW